MPKDSNNSKKGGLGLTMASNGKIRKLIENDLSLSKTLFFFADAKGNASNG
jgi:hypothetical protein